MHPYNIRFQTIRSWFLNIERYTNSTCKTKILCFLLTLVLNKHKSCAEYISGAFIELMMHLSLDYSLNSDQLLVLNHISMVIDRYFLL